MLYTVYMLGILLNNELQIKKILVSYFILLKKYIIVSIGYCEPCAAVHMNFFV